MKGLVCSVRKGVVTIYGEKIEKFTNIKRVFTPNNIIHREKPCPPSNFYLKNGMYDLNMSAFRKEKLARLDLVSIKEAALNNLLTKIDLKLLK